MTGPAPHWKMVGLPIQNVSFRHWGT